MSMRKWLLTKVLFILLLLSSTTSLAEEYKYKFDVLQSCGGYIYSENGYVRSEFTCYSESATDPVHSDKSCTAMESNKSETSLESHTMGHHKFTGWTVVSGDCSFTDASKQVTTLNLKGEGCVVKVNRVFTNITLQAGTGGSVIGEEDLEKDCEFSGYRESTSGVRGHGNAGYYSYGDSYFSYGYYVKITATPDNSYRFVNWTVTSGGEKCSIEDKNSESTSISVPYENHCTVKANFMRTGVLTVTASTGGSVSPTSKKVDVGSKVNISATPDNSYRFVNWSFSSGSDKCSIADKNSKNTTITVNGDCKIKANFVKTAVLTIGTASGGSTSPSGSKTVDVGSEVKISATPDANYVFSSWSKATNCPVKDNHSATTYVTVNGDCTIKPAFVKFYELTLTAGTGGKTTETTKRTYASGSAEVSVTATPNSGYRFNKWVKVSGGSACYVIDETAATTNVHVRETCKIQATFVRTYELKLAAGTGGETNFTSKTVDTGSKVDISASPNQYGYRFDKWTSSSTNCTVADPTSSYTTVTVKGACTVTASFVQRNTFAIGPNIADAGTTSPYGYQTIDKGSSKSITATPNPSYRFDNWTTTSTSCVIVDATNASTSVKVSADCSITANFVKTQQLTVSAGTGGNTSSSGTKTVDYGSSNTITATADPGYRFDKWTSTSESCVISDAAKASTSVEVSDDCSVKASFVKTYTFSVIANIDAGGTTSPDSEQTVDEGSSNAISATPNSGYRFDKWGSSSTSCVIADTTSDSTTVKVSADCSITANFVKTQQLTLSAGTGGKASSSGAKTVDYGSSNTITASPDSGYRFDKWTSTSESCVISDAAKASTSVEVSDDCSVKATFVKIYTFSVAANIDAGGTTSPNGEQTVDKGSSKSIKATPSSGYRFDEWTSTSKSCVISKATSKSTSVKISDDCKVTANFVKTQNVTIASNPGGTVSSPGSKTVDINTKIDLRAVEDTGYVFEKWVSTSKKCVIEDPTSLSSTVKVGDDCSLTANFIKMEYVFLEEDFVRDIDSVETTEVNFAFSLNTVSPTYDKADTIMVALFTDMGDTLWVPAFETDTYSGEFEGHGFFKFVTSPKDQKDDVLDAAMDLDADANRAVIRMQIGKDNSALDSRDSIVVFYEFIPAVSAEIQDQDLDGRADFVRVHFAKSIIHEQLKIDTLFWGGAEDDGRSVTARDMKISDDGDWIYAALESPFEYGVTAVDSTGKKFVSISRKTSSAIQKVTLSDKVGPVPVRAEKRPGAIGDNEYLNGKVDIPPDTLVVTLSEPVKLQGGAKAFNKKRSAWSNMFQFAESCDNGKMHPVSLEESPKLDKSGTVWTMVIPHKVNVRVGHCLMTNPEAPFRDAADNAPAIGGVTIEGGEGVYIYSFKAAPAVARDTISAVKVDARMRYKAKITIFSNFGNVVAQFSRKNDEGVSLIEWNQRAVDDRLVGTGVYIWRIRFIFADGHKETRFIRTGIKR